MDNKSSNSHTSDNNAPVTRRCKDKLKVIQKMGILHFDINMKYTNNSVSDIHDRCNNDLLDILSQIWFLNMMLQNHLEIMGMQELERGTKAGAVQNFKYQEAGAALLTPEANRKIKQTSQEIERHSKKGIHRIDQSYTQHVQLRKMRLHRKKDLKRITY